MRMRMWRAYALSLIAASFVFSACEPKEGSSAHAAPSAHDKTQTSLTLRLTSATLGTLTLQGQTQHMKVMTRGKGYAIMGEYLPSLGVGDIRSIASADGQWVLVAFSLSYPVSTVGPLTPGQRGDLRLTLQKADAPDDKAKAHQVMSLLVDAKVALVSTDDDTLHITFEGPVSVISKDAFGKDEQLTLELKQPLKGTSR